MKLIKNYKKLGHKEFMSRWKRGIEGITPLQQVNNQIFFTLIVIIGILSGFTISLFNLKNLWWLSIILFGAGGNTLVSLLGLYQRRFMLQKFDVNIEDYMKGGQEENEQESTNI